jgi:hypothetical protein
LHFGGSDRGNRPSPYFDLNFHDFVDRGAIFISDPTMIPPKNICPNAFQFGEVQKQLGLLFDKLSETRQEFLTSVQNWRKTDESSEGDYCYHT